MLLQDDIEDKEVTIDVDMVGHVSPDVRQRFAPLERLVPEQKYKQNVDLDLHMNRRPSERSMSPKSGRLISNSHRKNVSENGDEKESIKPSARGRLNTQLSYPEPRTMKFVTEKLESRQSLPATGN